MNYGELKARVARDLHRTDLDNEIIDFIEVARVGINNRFDTELAPFEGDTDTNTVLTEIPMLYIWAALAEGFYWLHNGEAAGTYEVRWSRLADTLNITNPGSAVDAFPNVSPVVQIAYS